jgi:imidazolonepropionase-like amidohydrolase
LVTGGKIVEIGHALNPPAGALIINADRKHVTPGLIDAHSHTAMTAGVNEAAQAVIRNCTISTKQNTNS